jgi:hypothetical protein
MWERGGLTPYWRGLALDKPESLSSNVLRRNSVPSSSHQATPQSGESDAPHTSDAGFA